MPITVGSPTGFAPTEIGVAFDPGPGSIDDESLLMLLQSRLRDLDGQIGDITRTLQRATAEAQRLGQEASRFEAVRQLLSREPQMDASSGTLRLDDEIPGDQLYSLAESLDIDPADLCAADTDRAGGVTVRELLAHVQINGESLSGVTTRDALQRQSETLGECVRQCNSGNEQQMVRLQSAMQQRTQAVTMVTNMLRALDESRDAITGNLR